MIAEKLSHQNQIIQTELSVHQGIFDQICHAYPKSIYLPLFNKKLPLFSSPEQESLGSSEPIMRGSVPLAFPPTSLIAIYNQIIR